MVGERGRRVVGEEKVEIEERMWCVGEEEWRRVEEVEWDGVGVMECGKLVGKDGGVGVEVIEVGGGGVEVEVEDGGRIGEGEIKV